MANRRPRAGHSTGGARPQQADTVTPDEVITDARPLERPAAPAVAPTDEEDAADEAVVLDPPAAQPADAPVAPATGMASTAAPVPGNVFDAARNAVITATDLAPPRVHRGPAVAERDMYDNGGPRGGLRLVARAGQVIPAWYRGL